VKADRPWGEAVALSSDLSSDQADQYALVLAAAGIDYRFQRSGWGWTLNVDSDEADRARFEVDAYLRENPPPASPDGHHSSTRQAYPPTITGLAAALLLLVFHLATVRHGAHESFIQEAGASAAKILDGEYWRTITALTLHADARHLAGNMLGLAVFGTFLCRRVGFGAAWLLIVLAGAGGNLLNAWLHQTGFLSIGASTAVFGAVGLLGGVRILPRDGSAQSPTGSWLAPLGAALGLLAMLGTDIQTDIGAHLMGCLVGMVLGLGYARLGPRHLDDQGQAGLLLAALMLLGWAWWRVVGA
jgi:rhomboid protease GluP